MFWLKVSCLVGLFGTGLFYGWQSFQLLSGRNLRAISIYKGATPDQESSLARHHGLLLVGFSVCLIGLPILIIALQIRFEAWAILMVAVGGSFEIVKRIIEQKHGIKHSEPFVRGELRKKPRSPLNSTLGPVFEPSRYQ